ncbi:hypothetical protein JO41_01655 [Treponema sp. OMZ 838]|nr:hypothetical protein JO41_01655 [Treponema sp. OMZ 838]
MYFEWDEKKNKTNIKNMASLLKRRVRYLLIRTFFLFQIHVILKNGGMPLVLSRLSCLLSIQRGMTVH